jgi:ribonuclease III
MKAVFTHQGVLGGKDNLDNNQSYERLEFLGDAYIEVIASRLLWDRFPTLSPGRLSALRELLVKNETLCEYALQYQFDRRVTLPTLVHEKGFTKIMGDVFEAYVAAVIVSNPKDGYAQAEAWLTQLWTPKLDKHKDTFKSDKLAKQELSKKLGGKGIQIQYVDDGPPEQLGDGLIKYYVSVYLTGWGWTNQRLGSGEGFNKIEAGNAAATWALTNTPLIDNIAIVKQAFDAKVRAQRESQCQSAE